MAERLVKDVPLSRGTANADVDVDSDVDVNVAPRIVRAFELALSRPPDATQLRSARAFYNDQRSALILKKALGQ